MKKTLSLLLASLFVLASLCGCAAEEKDTVTAASSSAEACAEWLAGKVGGTGHFAVGIGNSSDYGVDLSGFREDGYIIRKIAGDTVLFGKTEDALDRAVRRYVSEYKNADSVNVAYGEGYRVGSVTVAGRDISEYSIYLDAEEDYLHTFAADELASYIEKTCGVRLPVVKTPAEHNIVLEQVMPGDERYAVLGDEGYTVSVTDTGDLYISGGRWRGCAYGVYGFLRDYIGWRFLFEYALSSSSVEYLYEADTVDIPAGTNETCVPSFDYRYSRLSGDVENLKHGDNQGIREKKQYNGFGVRKCASHGLLNALNAGVYGDLWTSPGVQPCYTNEEFIEASYDYYMSVIAARVEAGDVVGKDIVTIDVAQADTTVFCECRNCLAAGKKDGNYTGIVLQFTNKMAEMISETYPGLDFAMLAYLGTIEPPKVTRPAENVSIAMCYWYDVGYNACYTHSNRGDKCDPVAACDRHTGNAYYYDYLKQWTAIASRVDVWIYPGKWGSYMSHIAGFYSVLGPLYDTVKALRDAGASGIYNCMSNELDYEDVMVPYLISRLNWEPDMTEEEYWELVREYMALDYGDVGGYVYEFTRRKAESGQPLGCRWIDSYDSFNPQAYASQFDENEILFEKALALAPDSRSEEIIKEISVTMYLPSLIATYVSDYENGTEGERELYSARYEKFRSTVEETGFLPLGTRNREALDAPGVTNPAFFIVPSESAIPAGWKLG